jgi:hypothetical protein
VLVAAGVVMLVTPGPGLLVVAAGLAVLAREFRWARRLLASARERLSARFGHAPHRSREPVRADPGAYAGMDEVTDVSAHDRVA